MSLSVCCFTNVPGSVLAASLAPLRAVADEIIVAFDARTDPQLIGPVLDIADQVHRVEVGPPFLERVLGWLLAQCNGTWVFRIDGDEIPSSALVDALENLDEDDPTGQYLTPRRWLYPKPDRFLEDDPWYPDFQARLVRNTPHYTTVEGHTHSSVRLMDDRQYLMAPLYHTACLVAPYEERLARSEGYEQLRPGHRTASGQPMATFYLPEDAGDPATAEVPAEDVGLVEAVISTGPVLGIAPEIPIVPLTVIDEFWPGRRLTEEDYRCSIDVLWAPSRALSGSVIEVVVGVTNLSPGTWLLASASRLGGRWLRGGSVFSPEGRAALPASVAPGETVVIPMWVTAPPDHDPSDVLEIDMVDEGVSWFGHGVELIFD